MIQNNMFVSLYHVLSDTPTRAFYLIVHGAGRINGPPKIPISLRRNYSWKKLHNYLKCSTLYKCKQRSMATTSNSAKNKRENQTEINQKIETKSVKTEWIILEF